jgi:hypothetical protein
VAPDHADACPVRGDAVELADCDGDVVVAAARAAPRRVLRTMLPQPPVAVSLVDEAAQLLQHHAGGPQFDYVVVGLSVTSPAGSPSSTCTNFLACASLMGMHVLLAVPPVDTHVAVRHYLQLCEQGKGPLSAVLLQDPQSSAVLTDLLQGIQQQTIIFNLPAVLGPASALWRNVDGSYQPVPRHSSMVRLATPVMNLVMAAVPADAGDILTVRAGIHQTSIAVLLDTGAGNNFMSATVAAAMDLPVQPDRQNLNLVLADGSVAPITGSVTVPVCIGRFRATVTFLVTELNPGFDAVLGYTWLRQHCDLQLTQNKLVFKSGSKVAVHRIPRLARNGPTHRWSTGTSWAERGVAPQQLRRSSV